VRQALIDKGFRIRPSASFAVLNVGVAINICKGDLDLGIEIIALGEAHDPSHTGIFGYTAYNTDVATRLASSVSPNDVHAAA